MEHRILIFFHVLIAFLQGGHLQAQLLSPEMGTIVVTYEIHSPEEGVNRLDRIHFWLINESDERTLYPKKDEFVSNSHSPSERTVVITNLPPGYYQIEFLVPNVDQYFEEVPPRKVQLLSGDVVKVDQTIRPYQTITQNTNETALTVINNYPSPLYPYRSPLSTYPSYANSSPYLLSSASISVTSNQNVGWELLLKGRVVYKGMGSESNITVPPGRNYSITGEQIPGYSFITSPKIPFDIAPGQITKIELFYQRDTGYLTLEGDVPSQVKNVIITLTPQQREQVPIKATLVPVNGKVVWKSHALLTGGYNLAYYSPELPGNVHNQPIIVEKRQRSKVRLFFGQLQQQIHSSQNQTQFSTNQKQLLPEQKGSLQIFSDSPQAIYTLSTKSGVIIGQGKGYQYTFEDVDSGYYILQFSSSDPNLAPSKQTEEIFIDNNENEQIKISYRKLGRLIISSHPNDLIEIKIVSINDQSEVLNEKLLTASHTFRLPEGKYKLLYRSVKDPSFKSIDINIRASSIQSLSLPEDEKSLNQKKDEATLPRKNSVLEDIFIEIPAGIAIIGDPFSDNLQNERPAKEIEIPTFSIGMYPVTNGQYAHWLNQAIQSKIVHMGAGNREGFFFNRDNQLLCKTMEANPLSQLSTLQTEAGVQIIPLPGKENYPVIEVTLYGAQTYCESKGYRLPSESEWEKAAGMSLSNTTEKPKRFKFGFGRDTIDRTWANYRDVSTPSDPSRVLTTPVGFYNGTNTLPLTIHDHTLVKTNNAKSPAGAYDMSGNVWEWVDSSVVKGGCYDSLAEGVRVAERLQLARDHSDIFTGFRVAK